MLANLQSFASYELKILEKYNCEKDDGSNLIIKVTQIGEHKYFNIELNESTSVGISLSQNSDYIYNDDELFYHSKRKEWITNEWTGLPMYTYGETTLSYDKKTKEGSYFSKHKTGLLSRASGLDFDFICE